MRGRRVLSVSAVGCLLAAGALSNSAIAAAETGPTLSWSLAQPAQSPHPSYSSSMAFDAATGQLVLFGTPDGGSCPTPLTWTWDGAGWTSHTQANIPAGREYPTLAYDPHSKQVVMFGGTAYTPGCATGGGQQLTDTWAWNGGVWSQQHPTTAPAKGDCAAFDDATGQLIMFGGANDDETWTWDGSQWGKLVPATVPQAGGANPDGCSMTYDAARHVVVMLTPDDSGSADGALTWTWNGTDWSAAAPLPPLPPGNGVEVVEPIAYDSDTQTDVVYAGRTWPCELLGGSHSSTCTNTDQTWQWNGSGWSQANAANPPVAGQQYALNYDGATHQLVMFGGWTETAPSGFVNTTSILAPTSSSAVTPTRISGPNRQGTAAAVSQTAFPTDMSASAVVLARADVFADALAGGPLAAAKHAPLLLTSPGSLDDVTKAEILRVLPKGGTVYLLGGTSALSENVASQIRALGDVPTRVAGADRFATAVAIANTLGNPTTVFEASGVNFPDALSAVPAAVVTRGAILLTNGSSQVSATASYMTAHAGSHYAVGGPSSWADPSAIALAGSDRYATSEAVALAFFPSAAGAGVASGVSFPDALAAGPVSGISGDPILLVPTSGALPEPIGAYLSTRVGTLGSVQAFGGPTVISDDVLHEVAASTNS